MFLTTGVEIVDIKSRMKAIKKKTVRGVAGRNIVVDDVGVTTEILGFRQTNSLLSNDAGIGCNER